MDILFIAPGLTGSGVDYSSTLATELEKRGHNVTALCFATYPQIETISSKPKWTLRSVDRYIWENITSRHPWITGYGRWAFNWLFYHRWKRAVVSELQDGAYDIVVTTRICIAPSVIAANEQGVPSVIITTGPATVKYDPADDSYDKTPSFREFGLGKKIQYPFILAVHSWNEKAFATASEIVSVGEFDASVTRETFGREPTIIYIPVPLEEFRTDKKTGSNITLVNPRDSNKGLDMFLEIANRLPDESFLIAGSLYDDSLESVINEMENVTYLGYCEDMSIVYAATKLLLTPSTYQEGGNRVIIEAFANGIPTIGSDIGGIPEYIGEGGDIVTAYTDSEAWVEVIDQYLTDREYYETKSKNARQRSQLFEQDHIVTTFEELLSETVTNSG
jgi:glycosyltransferase involved in cell wall biosynthesis